jgi:hypothetical protein
MRIIAIAALFSLPIIATATTPTLAAGNYGSSANGGGSPGYNRGVATDYKLKKHVKKLHAQVKPKAAKQSRGKQAQVKPKAAKPSGGKPAAGQAAGGGTPGAAGGAAAKQPMGRP